MTAGRTRAPQLAALARLARTGDAAALARISATVRAALVRADGVRSVAADALGLSSYRLREWLAPDGVLAAVGREWPGTHRGRRPARPSAAE